ncbi:MAG: hypothetical protein ACOCWR_03600 [Oceanidesulfovibrio sp.]
MTSTQELHSNAVKSRMVRAREVFEDTRVLALAFRWNGCVCRLCDACTFAMDALLLHRGLRNPKGLPIGGQQAWHLLEKAKMPPVLASSYAELVDKCRELETRVDTQYGRDDTVELYAFAEEFIDYIEGVVGG